MAFTILVVGVGSIAMMIVSPVLGPRNFLFAYFALGFYCIFILSQIIKKTSIGVVCALVAIAIINYSVTLEGYRANHIVYVENNKLISEWVNTNRKSTLIQYKLIDDRFAWSLPYVSEFHERVYKVWIIEYKGFEIEWVDFAKPM